MAAPFVAPPGVGINRDFGVRSGAFSSVMSNIS